VLSKGAEKFERDVLGGPTSDIADDDVGREAPGVVRVHYYLRAKMVVACLTRLPALVEDSERDDEGGKRRQDLGYHRDVHDC
jgi:hypothetical protein